MKKLLLGIGTVSVAIVPMVAVLSCGNDKPSTPRLVNGRNIEAKPPVYDSESKNVTIYIDKYNFTADQTWDPVEYMVEYMKLIQHDFLDTVTTIVQSMNKYPDALSYVLFDDKETIQEVFTIKDAYDHYVEGMQDDFVHMQTNETTTWSDIVADINTNILQWSGPYAESAKDDFADWGTREERIAGFVAETDGEEYNPDDGMPRSTNESAAIYIDCYDDAIRRLAHFSAAEFAATVLMNYSND